MNCPICGAENRENAQNCNQCGNPLTTPAAARPQRRMDVSDNSGALQDSFNTTTSTTNVVSQRTDQRNSGLVLFALFAVIVIGLIVLVALVYNWQNNRDAAAAQAQIVAMTATAQVQATEEARVEKSATAEAAALAATQATAEAVATATTVAALATASYAPTATQEAVAPAYARGVAAANIGDWPLAYSSFRVVFDVDPNYEEVQDRLRTASIALTPSPTVTPSPTPLPSDTPTPLPPTETPMPTATPTASPTATPTATPTASPTPLPTATPTATRTATATQPLATPTRTPTATPTALSPTATPTPASLGQIQVFATGVGFAKDDPNSSMRERSAILAAELDGKRKLVAWINGEEIEAVTVVNGGTVDIDVIRLVVQGRISRVITVSQTYNDTTRKAEVELMVALDRSELP